MPHLHPNEELLRRAYRMFAEGNIPAFLDLCTPDIRFRVPGSAPFSGEHGRDEFLALLGEGMRRVNNTFRESVVHLAANDTNGFVLAAQTVFRDGQTLQWNAVHNWQITNGKLAHFWEFTDDQPAFERAWRV